LLSAQNSFTPFYLPNFSQPFTRNKTNIHLLTT